jgi:hypothetical protein
VHRRFCGLAAPTLATDPKGGRAVLCRHLAVCTLRPDVLCGAVTEALVEVAQVRLGLGLAGGDRPTAGRMSAV